MKIDYEDIPKARVDSLRKQAFRHNRVIRLWNSLSLGGAILLAFSITKGVFPQRQDFIGCLILGCILAVLLAILFWKAVVDPQIRRAVERIMAQSENIT